MFVKLKLEPINKYSVVDVDPRRIFGVMFDHMTKLEDGHPEMEVSKRLNPPPTNTNRNYAGSREGSTGSRPIGYWQSNNIRIARFAIRW
jgi:hypothetical protein